MGKKGKSKGGKGAPAAAPVESLREYTDGNSVDLSHQDRKEAPVAALAANLLLTKVDLSGNGLTALQPAFGELSHLVHLNLSKNKLSELPDSFGELTALRWLDLFGNDLTRLPYTFAQLRDLRWLDLKGNPIADGFIAPELIGACSDDTECRTCARNVVARVTDLWAKRRKNDDRLERRRLREAEEARAAEKERKAAEKIKRREAWLKEQAEKEAERKRAAAAADDADDTDDNRQSPTKAEDATDTAPGGGVLGMLSPVDRHCRITTCGLVMLLLLLPMVLLLAAGAGGEL